LAIALIGGCGEDPAAPVANRFQQVFTTLYSNLSDKTELVVSTPDAWAQTWAQISSGSTSAANRPAVDFATEDVVVVALGEKRKAGFAVRIDQVEFTDSTRNIIVVQTVPAESCSSSEVITTPLDAAVVSKTGKPTRFIERLSLLTC
jgi:hypothetical protein